MIIVMAPDAQAADVAEVVARIRAAGLTEHISRGTERTLIGAIGDERTLDAALFERMPGVERALRVVREYRLIGREVHPETSIVTVRGQRFGGQALAIIAGPPAVESTAQIAASAAAVRQAGGHLLHGGAFLNSDNPYGFQGLGVEGLSSLAQQGRESGLPTVSEITDLRSIDAFLELDIDALAIGARQMANTDLLREIGRLNKPVILKRGPSASLNEWLMAAETVAAGGNHRIIFCECGIKSFEPAYNTLLDLGSIPQLKAETHLPVIVEPALAAGKAWMTPSLAAAAIAAGADGLWLDVHPEPAQARHHAERALSPTELSDLLAKLRPLATAVGRIL